MCCAALEMKMLISFQIREKPDISLLLLPYRDKMVADTHRQKLTLNRRPFGARLDLSPLGQELENR